MKNYIRLLIGLSLLVGFGNAFSAAPSAGAAAAGEEIKPLQEFNVGDDLRSVGFSLDGSKVATGSTDGMVKILNLKTGKIENQFKTGNIAVSFGVAFSGSKLITGLYNGKVRIWDIATGKMEKEFKAGDDFRSFTFSLDGSKLITGSRDGTVRILNIETGKVEKQFNAGDDVFSIAISRNGDRVVTKSIDGTVRIWNIATGKMENKFKAGDNAMSVAISPDGSWVATGSYDGAVRIWNVETGKVNREFNAGDDSVWGIAFSPDGSEVATGSALNDPMVKSAGAGMVKIWSTGTVKIGSTGPVQQQTMSKSWVKEKLPRGRKDIEKVIPLFQQDMAAHQTENAKIPPKTDDIFRIMSYNVHFWTGPDQKPNDDAMWQVVDQVKPDVLVLQEASGTADQGDPQVPDQNSPMVKTFTAKGYKVLSTCNTMPGRWFGNIVASKVSSSRMDRAAFDEQERPGEEDRCFSYMALTLPNGKKLHIYGTHLEVGKIKGFDSGKLRDQQVKQISNYIQGNLANENVLIVGDFNATRWSYAVKNLIGAGFKDSFATLGWQNPMFTSMFGSEIDFMFLNPGWNLPLAGAYVYYDAASDHMPIIMDIKLD